MIGGELTEYTDIYGVNYTFNNFTLGDAVGNKDYLMLYILLLINKKLDLLQIKLLKLLLLTVYFMKLVLFMIVEMATMIQILLYIQAIMVKII